MSRRPHPSLSAPDSPPPPDLADSPPPSPPASDPAGEPASSTIDGSHLAAVQFEPLEGEVIADDADGGQPAGRMVSRDEFFAGFSVAFSVGACIPPYLSSLTIRPEEEAAAREASGALYDICCETPALRFLIEPGGKWVPRIMALGAFAVPKALAVREELAARQPPPAVKVAPAAVAPGEAMARPASL